jgi:hypothetical protein
MKNRGTGRAVTRREIQDTSFFAFVGSYIHPESEERKPGSAVLIMR